MSLSKRWWVLPESFHPAFGDGSTLHEVSWQGRLAVCSLCFLSLNQPTVTKQHIFHPSVVGWSGPSSFTLVLMRNAFWNCLFRCGPWAAAEGHCPWQWWSSSLPAAFFTVVGQKCLCLHPSAGHKQTSLWYSIWVQSSRKLTTRKIWSTSEYWSASEWSCTRYGESSTAAHCCWKDRLLPPLLSPCFPLSPCTDAVNLAVSWFSMLTEQETHHWMAFCWVSKLNKLTEKSDECQNWHRTGQKLCSWTSPCWLQQPLALYTTYPCS